MNTDILMLQKELLLEQLMDIEEKLNDNGIKKSKQGFSLFVRNGVFYVRYTDLATGKQIPTNRSLETANRNEAETLARKYRESILKSYYDKKNRVKDIVAFFSEYYKPETPTYKEYLQKQLLNNERRIDKPTIRHFEGFITNHFIPFLKEQKIKRMNEITLAKLKEFQSFLVEKGLNPKTINNNINGAIKQIFSVLYVRGIIKQTPFTKNLDFTFNLPQNQSYNKTHILPIYDTLQIVMDKDMWKLYKTKEDKANNIIANPLHYKKYRLLCLLGATCGLRNAEIFMLRKENIVKIRRTYFIDVVNSRIGKQGLKTENAKRKVPIPAITLEALQEYIEENGITDYLFYSGSKTIHYNMFGFATNLFGCLCGYTEKELAEKNIDFYSFRHLYKTMLQRSDIKEDIIEYFMGHAVNVRNMNENYNKIEDLDAVFYEETGLKVIEYIDNQCEKVRAKYELLPVLTASLEQVSLTDNKKNIKTYFADVLIKIDFEEEINLFIGDLQEKGVLINTDNKEELINGLKGLLEKDMIDNRRYEDCKHFIENADFLY